MLKYKLYQHTLFLWHIYTPLSTFTLDPVHIDYGITTDTQQWKHNGKISYVFADSNVRTKNGHGNRILSTSIISNVIQDYAAFHHISLNTFQCNENLIPSVKVDEKYFTVEHYKSYNFHRRKKFLIIFICRIFFCREKDSSDLYTYITENISVDNKNIEFNNTEDEIEMMTIEKQIFMHSILSSILN